MNGHTNHQGQPQRPSLPKKMQPRKSKEIEGVMTDGQGDSSLPKKMQPRKSNKNRRSNDRQGDRHFIKYREGVFRVIIASLYSKIRSPPSYRTL